MEIEGILREFGLVLAVGLVSVPIARLLHLPLMVVLVVAGVIAGQSVTGLLSIPLGGVGTELVFTLGVALILFHGGLGISLRVISKTAVGLLLLAVPGVMLTAAIVAVAVMPLFGVSFQIALLAGAVLAATDPAILIPLFDSLGLRAKVAQTVVAESAINDPMGAILSLTVAGVVTAGSLDGFGPATDFARSIVIGIVLGVVAGLALAVLLSSHWSGVLRDSPAATLLALVALVYFSAEAIGGSAYLAAFIAGVIVGNKELLRISHHDHHEQLFEGYVAQTTNIVVLAVFVILGVNLDLGLLLDNLVPGLITMAVFILIARPVTVGLCLIPDRRGRWTRRELVFISWCRETGVVPVAIAGALLSDQVPGAELVSTLVTFAVLVTLLLQATTAGWLAARLGLLDGATEPR